LAVTIVSGTACGNSGVMEQSANTYASVGISALTFTDQKLFLVSSTAYSINISAKNFMAFIFFKSATSDHAPALCCLKVLLLITHRHYVV
jgi:hypothetical protein